MRGSFSKINFLQVLVCFLVSCGGGGGGGSDSGLSQDACGTLGLNPKIIDGTECGGLNTSPVVRIFSDFASGVEELCSGTMVTHSVVLTAVHCFINFDDSNDRVISSRVEYGDVDNIKSVNVSTIKVSNLLRVETNGGEQNIFNDFAVLGLSHSVPLPILPILASREPMVGEVVQIFGYGRTSTGDSSVPSDNLGLFSGETKVDLVTNNHISVTFLSGGTGSCFGDSGGPLVVKVNGVPAIAGVLSGFVGSGPFDCSQGLTSQYTNLQSTELLSDILKNVPGAGTI